VVVVVGAVQQIRGELMVAAAAAVVVVVGAVQRIRGEFW
jgi:hypothetical protein